MAIRIVLEQTFLENYGKLQVTWKRKANSRTGIVVAVSLTTLDSAGSGERGRADSSKD